MSKQDATDSFKNANDFVVKIYWIGDEDKPFYRAQFVSFSQSAGISQLEPFWHKAVISAEEFQHLLAVLIQSGVPTHEGAFAGETSQYITEIEVADQIHHWELGANKRTLTILREIEKELRPTNRAPIQQIIERASAAFVTK